ASQSQTRLLAPDAATVFPSGEKARQSNWRSTGPIRATSARVAKSQIFTSPAVLAVARRLPSEENATAPMPSAWAGHAVIFAPVVRCHSSSEPSLRPIAWSGSSGFTSYGLLNRLTIDGLLGIANSIRAPLSG